MLKKFVKLLSSVPAVIVSGVFLLMGLLPHVTEHFEKDFGFLSFLPIDPLWVTVIISGIPLVYTAFRKLLCNKGISRISSAMLISVAMVAAIIIGDIFAAGEVAFIMAIGEILEDKTTGRAKKGLQKLISLAPTTGRRLRDGREEVVAAKDIAVGDILRILPGETVPADGEIISGETSIDQSVMTGESLPVDKAPGDSVFSGTVNRFGAIDIRATKVGEDSSLQKLIKMVKDAEEKKAPMQRIADKWASLLVPVAPLIAVVAGLVSKDVEIAVTVLVVFCPCALVLATPTAIMAAIGQATKQGIIIKSGEALEKMGNVNVVAFDKTGTLTYGSLAVSDVAAFGIDKAELIRLAATAERKSEHPLGKAIVSFAEDNKIALSDPSDFRMEAGKGVCAKVDGKELYCGNEKFISHNAGTVDGNTSAVMESFTRDGKAAVIVAEKGRVLGVIALSDTLKENSASTVAELLGLDVKTLLLTGDNSRTADYFANRLGIDRVKAELLPQNKVEAVEELRSQGETVCMVGDGVNDAPALKAADVGVAMGTMGSDIALEASDIAIMCDDVSKLSYLKRLAKETVKTIKISITLSLLINLAAIILSFFKLLTPTTGALVHNAGSLLVILFAALLYDRKF